jgi:tRNA-2-methylthio-N6-dimethylallyladenosine synthase
VEVLVEGVSKRSDDVMVGHSKKNQTVHFGVSEGQGTDQLIGKLVDVRVEEARTWYLSGSVVGEPR